MLLILQEPGIAYNWMLAADCLLDPPHWNRFHPSHRADSERARFEAAVRGQDRSVGLVLRETLLKRGVCVFEYDWSLNAARIQKHALAVAEALNVELLVGGHRAA